MKMTRWVLIAVGLAALTVVIKSREVPIDSRPASRDADARTHTAEEPSVANLAVESPAETQLGGSEVAGVVFVKEGDDGNQATGGSSSPPGKTRSTTPRSASPKASESGEAGGKVLTYPPNAESVIWEVLGQHQRLQFTSIDSVVCQPTICEIRYTGGPDLSDSRGLNLLMSPLTGALPMTRSMTASSRVQISPGVYRSVFTLRSYIGSETLGGFKSGKVPQAPK